MTRRKTVMLRIATIITTCAECEYADGNVGEIATCTFFDPPRRLPRDSHDIPEWCELPDAEDDDGDS